MCKCLLAMQHVELGKLIDLGQKRNGEEQSYFPEALDKIL